MNMFFSKNILLQMAFALVSFIIVVACHEWTRAAVSTALGDVLPKNEKNLNPLKFVEPMGALLFIVTAFLGYGAFGWSRPARTSPMYYKNRKRDSLLVTILPSVANLLAAFVLLIVYKVVVGNSIISTFLNILIFYQVSFAVCNCIPVQPMDGAKVLSLVLPTKQYFVYMQYEKIVQGIFILLLLLGAFGGILDGITMLLIRGMECLLFFL